MVINNLLQKKLSNKKNNKFSKWLVDNKSWLAKLIFSLVLSFSIIGFSLFLYGGIGLEINDLAKNEWVSSPIASRNGVWYIESFIGGNLTINSTYIPDWDYLTSNFHSNGYENLYDFLRIAEINHEIYNVGLILFCIFFPILFIWLSIWILWKFVIKKKLMNKVSEFFNTKNTTNNESIKLDDQIQKAIDEIANNINNEKGNESNIQTDKSK